jgi:hypothetical protein
MINEMYYVTSVPDLWKGKDNKVKAILVTGCGDPHGYEKVRHPHVLDNWLKDGVDVIYEKVLAKNTRAIFMWQSSQPGLYISSQIGYLKAVVYFVSFFRLESFNSLRTGIILIWFWLLNVVDRSHNIMILGHAMLKHTILCTGDMMAHTFAFCRSRMLCLAVSKHDRTVFLSHSKRKCLCRKVAMPLCSSKACVERS